MPSYAPGSNDSFIGYVYHTYYFFSLVVGWGWGCPDFWVYEVGRPGVNGNFLNIFYWGP